METAFVFLAALATGLSAGAVLTEATVLVPFWRSQPPEAFLAWYAKYAGLLLRFYGPLEIVAAAATVLAAIGAGLANDGGTVLLSAAATLSVAVLAAYPAYFKPVNAAFAARTIDTLRVPDELRRWSRWHWARVYCALAAFACTVVAALQ
jgi:hypothetical protein